MTPKKFLLTLAVIAVAGWITGNLLFGPPGLTSDYLDKYGHEHEHYVELTKSEEYRLHQQRPELNAPGSHHLNPHFEAQLGFIEEYESRPEFVAQERRMGWYELYFDWFNAALVVIIAVHFGRRPFMNFTDGKIAEIKERLNETRANADAAAARKAEAMALMQSLPDEEARVSEEMRQRQLMELAELETANRHSIELMKSELEERRQTVYMSAEQRVKREMVDATIKRLIKWHEDGTTPEYQDQLLNQFIADLEQHA